MPPNVIFDMLNSLPQKKKATVYDIIFNPLYKQATHHFLKNIVILEEFCHLYLP